MVETGGVDCTRSRLERLAHLLNEFHKLVTVEGKSSSPAKHGLLSIGHFGQLLASEMIAIERNDRRDVWLAGGFGRRVRISLVEVGMVQVVYALGN